MHLALQYAQSYDESYTITLNKRILLANGKYAAPSISVGLEENGNFTSAALCASSFPKESLAIVAGIPSISKVSINLGPDFSLGETEINILSRLTKLSKMRIFSSDNQLSMTAWKNVIKLSAVKEVIMASSDFPKNTLQTLVQSKINLASVKVVFEIIKPTQSGTNLLNAAKLAGKDTNYIFTLDLDSPDVVKISVCSQ
jgi:hypothetical protein